MKRLIEEAKRQAVAFEQMLDVKMTELVRPAARPLEPLEIRNAILREIESQIIPGPHGTRVFPYNDITVQVRVRSAALDAALDATLEGLEAAARQRVLQRRCEMPRDFTLRVARVPAPPDDWLPNQLHRVAFDRVVSTQSTAAAIPAKALVLSLRGDRDTSTFRLAQGRLDIGRTADVCDRNGQLVRRNAVVISEAYDPNGTVSRRHAHIKAAADADGRRVFTVYDDGSRYGTRIVRDGDTLRVHAGTLGVRLRDGDELQLGEVSAGVRFESEIS
jgi:FHA domain